VTQPDLQVLTLSGIRHRCAQESDRFFNRQDYDPRYCYELFRRAIMGQNEQAWSFIYDQYQRLVRHWVERHAAFASSGEDIQFFVNRAFEKMWVGITPKKFSTFSDLKSLLRYLQMCVHSVLIDFVRQKEFKLLLDSVEDLERPPHAQETAVEDQIAATNDREAIWTWLTQQIQDEKEQLVLYGMFVLALKPREVQAKYPDTFNDVKEVYRTKENLIARLRRNEEFRQFWDDA
jgi:DNA-directed RNA polymerase specialized sigma24 family protein